MKINGKPMKKQLKVFSTYEWFDFILINNISPQIQKQRKLITEQSFECVYLEGYYYGMDLFQFNKNKDLAYWDYILYFNKKSGIVVKQNSLRSKYQIGIFHQ